MLAESSLDALADTSPDIRGGLFVVSGLGLPETNVLSCHFQSVSLLLNNGGEGAYKL